MHDDAEVLARQRVAKKKLAGEYAGLTLGQLSRMYRDPKRRAEAELAYRAMFEAMGPAGYDLVALFAGTLRVARDTAAFMAQLRDWVTRAAEWVAEAVAIAREWPEMVTVLYEPYGQQIESASEGRIPALSHEEQTRMVLLALLLTTAKEDRAGQLPPLEQVAMVAERFDIVAAVLRARHPELARKLAYAHLEEQANREEAMREAVTDVSLFLGNEFSQRASRIARELPPHASRAKLEEMLSEAYVMASLRNARLERRRHDQWLEARTDHEVIVEDDVSGTERADSRLGRLALEGALRTYLRESKRPELDARIIRAIQTETPMAALAKEKDVAVRTLRYRRRKIIARVAQLLLEEPKA